MVGGWTQHIDCWERSATLLTAQDTFSHLARRSFVGDVNLIQKLYTWCQGSNLSWTKNLPCELIITAVVGGANWEADRLTWAEADCAGADWESGRLNWAGADW